MNKQRAIQVALLLLRVVAGLLFFQVGAMKFGWYGGMPGGGTPPAFSQIWIGAILEIVGGIAIMLGLFARPVAFILAGEMAVAYWQFHAPHGTWPVQNQGQPAVLFCFIFLYFAARGAGDFSLDALIAKKRGKGGDAKPDAERT
jgi:putative oxidoreductase